jgi:hypothetical protein
MPLRVEADGQEEEGQGRQVNGTPLLDMLLCVEGGLPY